MGVEREEGVTVFVGPVVAGVDHRAAVRMSAAGGIVRAFAAARTGPTSAGPVDVIGALRDQVWTRDLGGSATTEEMTMAIIERLGG